VAGVEGPVQVHVPFSRQDLSQIEKRLRSFSANLSAYAKEFYYLSQAYDLTWHDIFIIMASTLTLMNGNESKPLPSVLLTKPTWLIPQSQLGKMQFPTTTLTGTTNPKLQVVAGET
jgi:hypothetical protein